MHQPSGYNLMIRIKRIWEKCSDSSSRHARRSAIGSPSRSVAPGHKSEVGAPSSALLYHDVHILLPAQHPMSFQLPAYPTEVSLPNGLICFTNCLLPMQDGSLVEKDLWIDERRGIVLDSQVRKISSRTKYPLI